MIFSAKIGRGKVDTAILSGPPILAERMGGVIEVKHSKCTPVSTSTIEVPGYFRDFALNTSHFWWHTTFWQLPFLTS